MRPMVMVLAPLLSRRLARILPDGLRLDGVEKRWRQLGVSKPRERCSFRCAPVWVHTSFRRVLPPDDPHAARSRPSANTRPIRLERTVVIDAVLKPMEVRRIRAIPSALWKS